MKKFIIVLSLFFFSVPFLLAQPSDLFVKRNDKGLYLEHTVAPKENFYAIGRLYNTDPKLLASFNDLDMSNGLRIGQVIMIPLTASNFIQQGNTGTPVYCLVEPNEGLMAVSNTYGNVKLVKLREWNGLKNDQLKPGQKLVIGFLQSKEMPVVNSKPSAVKEEQPVKKSEIVEKQIPEKEEKKSESKEPGTEEKLAENKNKNVQPVIQEELKTPVIQEGYFKSFFEQQAKVIPPTRNETVSSGIFKTISGWKDAKFYLLMDKVAPGTIVKLINPDNNKVAYAKVLGAMSGIRQNEGLDIRISNATASALDINETEKFVVKVNY